MPFPIGSRVLIRSEEWLVRGVQPTGIRDEKGKETYAVQVVGMSETVRDYAATFLTSLDDIQELRPEDVRFVFDDSPNYRRSRLFLHALMARTPVTEPGITTRGQAAMTDNDYQYVPAQTALAALRPRILIADGVGLGKTIEAGILLAELIRRGRGRRILVVSTRAMLEQLQKELWMRFSIPLIRLDSEGIARIRRNIPTDKNPFYYYDRAIISMDTLKSPDYQHYLENTRWDVVWIDECHNVANSDTQRRRMAEILARRSEGLILTSATPHNGKPESFAALLRMLDPTLVADPKNVRKEDLEGQVVRRYKADIVRYTGNFPKLHAVPVVAPATDDENRVLERLGETLFHAIHTGRPKRDRLFAVTLLKSFLSSPAALKKTAETRLRRLSAAGIGGKDPARERLDAAGHPEEDIQILQELVSRAAAIPIEKTAKFGALCRLLDEWRWDGSAASPRIVLFSERIDTLKELQAALMNKFAVSEDVVPVFTAQLSDVEQEEKVRSFNEERSPIRMLLASDVMSEGVNLHHQCHHLIHYDIPWSFIRLEQRNGRIDRFGQLHTPEVRYLVLKATGEAEGETRVTEKLVEKAQVIQQSLGDPAEVLHLREAEAEEAYIAEQLAEGADLDDLFGDIDPLDLGENFSFEMPEGDPLPRTAAQVPIRQLSVPGLYSNWLELSKDLGDEIPAQLRRYRETYGFDDHTRAGEAILIDPANQRVVVRGAGEEMQIRLRNLPREALPEKDLRLTTDPFRMMRRMYRATEEGGWTDEHLLWDVHPAADWMLDRALGLFGAREVPTVHLADLPEDETHYVIQTMVNTRSGYPVSAEWLVVTRREDGCRVRLWQGLDDPLLRLPWINAGEDPVVGRDPDLTEVLAAAREFVEKRAEDRRRTLTEKVERAKSRVRRWYEQELEPLQTTFDWDDPLARARRAKVEIRRHELRSAYEAAVEGYDRMLEFEAPVLRVCARLMRG